MPSTFPRDSVCTQERRGDRERCHQHSIAHSLALAQVKHTHLDDLLKANGERHLERKLYTTTHRVSRSQCLRQRHEPQRRVASRATLASTRRDEDETRRDERTKRAAVTWWSPLKLRRTRQEIDDKATRPRPQAGSRRRWRWRATSSDRVAATAGATDDEREAGGGRLPRTTTTTGERRRAQSARASNEKLGERWAGGPTGPCPALSPHCPRSLDLSSISRALLFRLRSRCLASPRHEQSRTRGRGLPWRRPGRAVLPQGRGIHVARQGQRRVVARLAQGPHWRLPSHVRRALQPGCRAGACSCAGARSRCIVHASIWWRRRRRRRRPRNGWRRERCAAQGQADR